MDISRYSLLEVFRTLDGDVMTDQEWKDEAREWLGNYDQQLAGPSNFEADVESLAALLRSVADEKDMEWREAFGVAADMTPMQVADHIFKLKNGPNDSPNHLQESLDALRERGVRVNDPRANVQPVALPRDIE